VAEKHQKKAWKAPQQGHLAQALEGWSNITQAVKLDKPIPPDEKILNDIKGLLTELKFKLDELSFIPTEKISSSPTPLESTPEEKSLETPQSE
jgi:hypothetical protein